MSTPSLMDNGTPARVMKRAFPDPRELAPDMAGPTHGTRPGRYWRTRCQVIKKNGEQCANWAMRGSTVCRVPQHGSSLPHVRAKAARRLERITVMSAGEYEYALLPYVQQALRFRAARSLLRMVGMTESQKASLGEAAMSVVDDYISQLKEGRE